jgi:hypothetical protein
VTFRVVSWIVLSHQTSPTETALLEILRNQTNAVALVREQEYARFAAADSQLKILAAGETYGHGGVTLKMLMRPQRERLFVIAHEP